MSRAVLSFAAVAALAGFAAAAEHPEHPKGQPMTAQAATTPAAGQEHPKMGAQEHPKGAKEHPAHEHPVGSKPWLKEMRKGYTAAVEKRVADDIKAGGFKLHDDKLGKDWNLKLDHVHKDRIVSLGGTSFFACADFKSADKGSKDKVDLDFYATKNGDAWSIDKILVHKVNGEPRYTYNDKNEMVPVTK